ncbi:hypothetical protein GGI24_004856, partial [Coemansia furcata]
MTPAEPTQMNEDDNNEEDGNQPPPMAAEETTSPAAQEQLSAEPAPTTDVDELTDAFENWQLNDPEDTSEPLAPLGLAALAVPQSNSALMEVQLLHKDAMMPCKAHNNDAGYDVSCVDWLSLASFDLTTVPLGIA